MAGVILLLAAAILVWYMFTEKFTDTDNVKADYTSTAIDLVKEFKKDINSANKKYAEKIIIVHGEITKIDKADTTANLIMQDTASGAYIIFAFQQQHLTETKQMRVGDHVSIKGSCSGGNYSEILETESINFKRCALNK